MTFIPPLKYFNYRINLLSDKMISSIFDLFIKSLPFLILFEPFEIPSINIFSVNYLLFFYYCFCYLYICFVSFNNSFISVCF